MTVIEYHKLRNEFIWIQQIPNIKNTNINYKNDLLIICNDLFNSLFTCNRDNDILWIQSHDLIELTIYLKWNNNLQCYNFGWRMNYHFMEEVFASIYWISLYSITYECMRIIMTHEWYNEQEYNSGRNIWETYKTLCKNKRKYQSRNMDGNLENKICKQET